MPHFEKQVIHDFVDPEIIAADIVWPENFPETMQQGAITAQQEVNAQTIVDAVAQELARRKQDLHIVVAKEEDNVAQWQAVIDEAKSELLQTKYNIKVMNDEAKMINAALRGDYRYVADEPLGDVDANQLSKVDMRREQLFKVGDSKTYDEVVTSEDPFTLTLPKNNNWLEENRNVLTQLYGKSQVAVMSRAYYRIRRSSARPDDFKKIVGKSADIMKNHENGELTIRVTNPEDFMWAVRSIDGFGYKMGIGLLCIADVQAEQRKDSAEV